MNENITIPVKVYERLLKAEEKLLCLEGAGVDNWEGYSYAMENYDGED